MVFKYPPEKQSCRAHKIDQLFQTTEILLQKICQSFQSSSGSESVDVLCPYLNILCATLTGFLLLEEVQAGLDSLEQRLLRLSTVTMKERLLSALASRVLRQQAKLEVKFEKVICYNMESAKVLAA